MTERSGKQAPPENLNARETQAPPFFNTSALPDQDGRRYAPSLPGVPPPTPHLPPAGIGRTMELPPLPPAPTRGAGSFSPASASRSAVVSLMLNPTEPEDSYHDRRRKIARTESARPIQSLPPLATSNPSYSPAGSSPAPAASLGARQPRRMLTPRLPPRSPSSLHRTVSLSQLPSTVQLPHQPSLSTSPRSRPYAIDTGSGRSSALPTPVAAPRQNYGFPAPVTLKHSATSQPSLGSVHGIRLHSESTSPKSSYSGYSQAEQASPVQYGSSSIPNLAAPYTAKSSTSAPVNDSVSNPTKLERHNQVGIPISSASGQNVYQMMTLETSSGSVQLPVDVQAASRVADEKRRRNAGASARFRQRRKEKEKESSTAISRLEQRLKDLSEDADFYKRERDYLLGVVLQVPGGDRHLPRPRSPRHRRTSSMGGSGDGGTGYVSSQDQGSRSPADHEVRRKTSTSSINLPPHRQIAVAALGPHPYGPHVYAQQHAPGLLPSPGGGGALLSGMMHPAPQSGVWNPYPHQRHPSGDHAHGTH